MSGPSPTPPAPPLGENPADREPSSDFDIGEEYGTARKNLPPAGIVVLSVVVVGAIVAALVLTQRSHPYYTGSIDELASVPIAGQDMVMVAVNVSIQNQTDKPSWIHTIQATLDTGADKFTDDAVPSVDAQRYFEAFPTLKQHALDILVAERRLDPGSRVTGTVVVSFPVKDEVFARRKSLTVTITPYEQRPLILTK